ncbi:hypothetical protein Tco_0214398 [Tanacetum coccineum]
METLMVSGRRSDCRFWYESELVMNDTEWVSGAGHYSFQVFCIYEMIVMSWCGESSAYEEMMTGTGCYLDDNLFYTENTMSFLSVHDEAILVRGSVMQTRRDQCKRTEASGR